MHDDRWTERDLLPCLWRVRQGGGRLHPPGSRMRAANAGRQPWGACLIQLTISGALEIQRRGDVRPCPAGFAALMWYGESSGYAVAQGQGRYESRWLVLDGPGLPEVWRDLIARSGGIIGPDRDGRLRLTIERATAARPPRDTVGRIELCTEVQALVCNLHRLVLRPGRSHGVGRAIEAMLADPCTCGSLTDLARRHGCSREHLVRRFTASHGEAPHRWLVRHRLERARILLADRGLGVAEVARACGWCSTRGLARALGHAPTRLRPG